jgi:hypothetical protein
MPTDLNPLLNRVKKLQKTMEQKLETSPLVQDLKKYAVAQQRMVKKRLNSNSDLKRALGYIEKQRRELDRVTKNLPKDMQTVKKFVSAQRREFEKVGKQLLKEIAAGDLKAVQKTARSYTGTMKAVRRVKKVARQGKR